MPFDYSTLPQELRLQALGLSVPDKNPGGRPGLSFRERMQIAIRHREVCDGLARLGKSTQHPKLPSLVKRIRHLYAQENVWKAAWFSKEADGLGRYHQIPILKPAEKLPQIDRLVAEEFGIKPRAVRSIREDKRIADLVGLPIWEPRDWLEVRQRVDVRIRQRAKQLFVYGDDSPNEQILAKIDRGEIVLGESFGTLAVLDEFQQVSLTPEQQQKAIELQRRCYAGGLGHSALGYLGGGGAWTNVVLEKVLSQAEYNQHIVDRVGLKGLKFLRAILHEGFSFEDAGKFLRAVLYKGTLGAPSPEDRALAFLRELLDRI